MHRSSQCVFEYLYRDASNYKQYEVVLLSGAWNVAADAAIRSALFESQYFIAEQVGLKPLQRRFGRRNDDDHIWHEFVELRAAASLRDVDLAESERTLASLVDAFRSVLRWDERLPRGLDDIP